MGLTFKGNAIVIKGEHINADTAMGWYLGMDTLPPAEIAAKFMSGIDPKIAEISKKGDILVCGRDFGFGKVHGALFTAMKAFDIKCIVADSFSTQMLQTALMFGTILFECPGILQKVEMGDEIEVSIESARVANLTKDSVIEGKKIPQFLIDVMNAGGQMGYLARKIAARKMAKA
jgi:3-isopropylmalate/(R)-2-methylmalate dehydratase small subunit